VTDRAWAGGLKLSQLLRGQIVARRLGQNKPPEGSAMTNAPGNRKAAYRCALIAVTSALLGIPLSVSAQTPTVPNRASQKALPKPTASSATESPQLKGILEPVNYGQDLKLTDVFFTSTDEGWVAGEHATILHTTDGGRNWNAQVGGEPNNQEQQIRLIRFLDSKHGWAVQSCAGVCAEGDRLFSTRDGQNWDEAGTLPRGGVDFAFTSGRHAIALTNGAPGYSRGAIFLTDDSGKAWKPLMECSMNTTVNGLAHTDGCWFVKLELLSHRTAYALACDNNYSFAFFHTGDSGRTWNYHVLPFTASDCRGADFFFTDSVHGVLVLKDGRTYITNDGGNWTALLATTLGPQIRFADPQVGWTLWSSKSNWRAARIWYTVDGGQHWKASADIDLPLHNGDSYKFAFPRRDRAYIIGDHGMIYRYRVVPTSYTASNAFNAPAMPSFDTSATAGAASRVKKDIADLQAQIATASGGTAPSPQTAAAAPPAGGFPQGPGGASSAQVQPSGSSPAATGDFAQDVGTFSSDPSDASFTQGFTQNVDTSPPSAPLQACCGRALQNLQTDLASFNQAAAANTSQFRSLNMVIAGVQLVTSLVNQARQLRDSFNALKHSSNLQAASTALQQLSTKANFTQKTVSTGFSDPGTWYATNAQSGGFVQDVSTSVNP
jgi:photosystem II stability/assembly factor-like uncharacterized protein